MSGVKHRLDLFGVLVMSFVARDVLVSEVPEIMRSELYAAAALAGATVVVVGRLLQFPTPAVAVTGGAAFCFRLRFLAIRRGWRLPVAPWPRPAADDENAPTP